MTKKDLETIQAKLLARREAILGERGRSYQRLQESSSDVAADPIDRAAGNCDFDVAVSQMSLEGAELVAIEEALGKIDSGDYGVCEDCEGPIAERRLLALPSARYCIECQARLEREGAELVRS